MAKKNNTELFNGTVAAGGKFTFIGLDKNGKMGSEIRILVDGAEHTKIHTSCSQPIGIGMVSGDFMVIDGWSLKGGQLCPIPDTPACTELTLQYNGTATAAIVVMAKKNNTELFNGTVAAGGKFTFIGADKHDKMGSEIRISVNGGPVTKLHTSCSQPIGIGMVFGDFDEFKVIAGESLKGGPFCPIP